LYPKEDGKAQGTGERMRMIRKSAPCKASLQVVAHHHWGFNEAFDKPHQYVLQLVNECVSHTHLLADIDVFKKPKALMKITEGEIANGYEAAAVLKVMKGRRGGV
ncbi:MAG: hypothetical protein M1835_003872, partial [Candelina submexicana]